MTMTASDGSYYWIDRFRYTYRSSTPCYGRSAHVINTGSDGVKRPQTLVGP